MTVEIIVTYARTKQADVPAELAPNKDWVYPDREAFDTWVDAQADELCKEDCQPGWVSTEAFETENWNEVYSI